MIYVILHANSVTASILMPLLLPTLRKTMHQEQGEVANPPVKVTGAC